MRDKNFSFLLVMLLVAPFVLQALPPNVSSSLERYFSSTAFALAAAFGGGILVAALIMRQRSGNNDDSGAEAELSGELE